MKFFIPCVPPKTTAQQKGAFALKTGGVRFFKKKKNIQAEESMYALFHPYKPAHPLEGPLSVSVTWIWPWRKSEPKKNMVGRMPMTSRPDLSNLEKALVDVLVRMGFMLDDSQIFDERLQKFWGDKPGIEIEINQVTGGMGKI